MSKVQFFFNYYNMRLINVFLWFLFLFNKLILLYNNLVFMYYVVEGKKNVQGRKYAKWQGALIHLGMALWVKI